MGNYREMIYSKNLEILNNMKNSNYWEKIPNAKFNTPINGNALCAASCSGLRIASRRFAPINAAKRSTIKLP